MATRRRSSAQDEPQGPWVQVAVFCDQFIIDKTDTPTLVRVIDQVSLAAPPGRRGNVSRRQWVANVVVSVRAGSVRGEGDLTLEMTPPVGKRLTIGEARLDFGDGSRGVTLAQQIPLRFSGEGLYWLDVRYEGRLLTRMPLTVRYQPAPAPAEPAPA